MRNQIFILCFLPMLFYYICNKDDDDDKPKDPWGANCGFNAKTNTFRCDVPKFYDNYKVFSYEKSYVNKLFVNLTVQGQTDCRGTIADTLGQKCQDFETLIATGAMCETPKDSLWSGLKTSLNSFCKSGDNKSVCTRHNSACPEKEAASDACCVIVKCKNKVNSCKLKANIVFSVIQSLTPSTQNIPLLSTSLELNGEGFPDKSNLAIACFNSAKANIGCKVVSSGGTRIKIEFNSPLTKTGPIFASLNSANALKADDPNSLVQIATVVFGSPWDYKYYIIGAVLIIFFLVYLWKKNISSNKGNLQRPGPAMMNRGVPYY
eukprot:GAHX01000536.1.p1 GENE.GAHX01000536.1~~GAHX01000536.1.p1  ORF type:complete len:320 (+),score=39.25 GAHX01000536.1:60-1019(+)